MCWYVCGSRDDTCEACMAAGAIGGSHRCHSHTDGAAQPHGLLSQHRLLIAHLSILWLAVGLLWILWLAIWLLLWILWLLAVLWLAVLLRLLCIRSLLWVCRIRRLSGLSLRCRKRRAASGAEIRSGRILGPAVGAEAGCRCCCRRCCRYSRALSAIRTECAVHRNLCPARRARMS